MSSLLVTIDGPSGTGKSTVSKAVALRLGVPHLDTGAFYRMATLAALEAGADLSNEAEVEAAVAGSTLGQEEGRALLDGRDVSVEIRSAEVTSHVSQVSAHARVRALLVDQQRAWAHDHGNRAVVEGRDIGSVVFPDAPNKIYLDARSEVRARRRADQDGTDVDFVLEDIRRRDHIDSSREVSPLSVPEGATVVDTSDLTFDQVVDAVVSVVSGPEV